MTPGTVAIVHSWDGKARPAIYLEQRGGDAVVLPFTSDHHVVRNSKTAHVAEWRRLGLRRESWLWNFLQKVPVADLSVADGAGAISSDLARRVVLLFGQQLKGDTVTALIEAAA